MEESNTELPCPRRINASTHYFSWQQGTAQEQSKVLLFLQTRATDMPDNVRWHGTVTSASAVTAFTRDTLLSHCRSVHARRLRFQTKPIDT